MLDINPTGIYLLKVNNRNTRARSEICSGLAIKIPERRQWRRSGIFIVNFEHISHLVLVFLLLALNMQFDQLISTSFTILFRCCRIPSDTEITFVIEVK